jgi:nucleotide-binding universal stress UspA family protein
MIELKSILCPVDFFPASEHALRYAMALAENYKSRLSVLHVVSPVMPSSYEFTVDTGDLVAAFKEHALERVAEMKSEAARRQIAAETFVRVGDVEETLRNAVVETKADLVVMGTHGRRGFERWFLGSVTERFLRRSTVPVLSMAETAVNTPVPPNVGRILVTTDFSGGAADAMNFAFAIAQEAPAHVTLLHVVEQPPERAQSAEEIAGILREHLDSMVPPGVRDWCTVEADVRIGTPYQRILAVASEDHADLIVMNIHGKGLIDRAVMGSTAERVIRGAECPVLSIPAPDAD